MQNNWFNVRGKMVAQVRRRRNKSKRKFVWRVYRPGGYSIKRGHQKRFSTWAEAVAVAIDWSTRIQFRTANNDWKPR